MAANSRVYIIGDRDTGIVVLMLNPLRAAMATRNDIATYAKKSGQTFDEAFGAIAGALKGLILKTDDSDVPETGKAQYQLVGDLVATGASIIEADFCFVSDVDSSQWKIARAGFIAIDPFVGALLDSVAGPDVTIGSFSDQN